MKGMDNRRLELWAHQLKRSNAGMNLHCTLSSAEIQVVYLTSPRAPCWLKIVRSKHDAP